MILLPVSCICAHFASKDPGLDWLIEDVCKANNRGRQRQCLPMEKQTVWLVALYKRFRFPENRRQVYLWSDTGQYRFEISPLGVSLP